MLYGLARKLLFNLDPETAHHLALGWIGRAGRVPAMWSAIARQCCFPEARPVEVLGLRFPNRIGLAAGYDKDGESWQGLAALGFGHIEIGTITPDPQPGNPRPRVFRLVEERSLINRMGFPGKGAVYVSSQLGGERPGGVILGANLGKQKSTPLEEAAHDYAELIDVFAPLADYLTVNISSPNTPGLRRLQERDFLEDLLRSLVSRRQEVADRIGRPVPLLVKLAPDLDDVQLDTAVEALLSTGIDGVIATNTTISRDDVRSPLAGEEGGLSGALLSTRSTGIIRAIHRRAGGRLPIIGAGGIMGPDDAAAKLDAGATLLQIYTGLVYEGPGIVRRILESIEQRS
jgi:dihydroorotate dehydrogenase